MTTENPLVVFAEVMDEGLRLIDTDLEMALENPVVMAWCVRNCRKKIEMVRREIQGKYPTTHPQSEGAVRS